MTANFVSDQKAVETHRLQPLLAPQSVAVVGASPREESYSYTTLRELLDRGYGGAVYPVNPRYERVEEMVCYPGS